MKTTVPPSTKVTIDGKEYTVETNGNVTLPMGDFKPGKTTTVDVVGEDGEKIGTITVENCEGTFTAVTPPAPVCEKQYLDVPTSVPPTSAVEIDGKQVPVTEIPSSTPAGEYLVFNNGEEIGTMTVVPGTETDPCPTTTYKEKPTPPAPVCEKPYLDVPTSVPPTSTVEIDGKQVPVTEIPSSTPTGEYPVFNNGEEIGTMTVVPGTATDPCPTTTYTEKPVTPTPPICTKVFEIPNLTPGTMITVGGKTYTVSPQGTLTIPLSDLPATGTFPVIDANGTEIGKITMTGDCEGVYVPTPPPVVTPEVEVEFEEPNKCVRYESRTFAIYYYHENIGPNGEDWYVINTFTTQKQSDVIVKLRPGMYYVVDITAGPLATEVNEDVLQAAVTPITFEVLATDSKKDVQLPADECQTFFRFAVTNSSYSIVITPPGGGTITPPGNEYTPEEPGTYEICVVDAATGETVNCQTIVVPEAPTDNGYESCIVNEDGTMTCEHVVEPAQPEEEPIVIPETDLVYRDPTPDPIVPTEPTEPAPSCDKERSVTVTTTSPTVTVGGKEVPVTEGKIELQMEDFPAGTYEVKDGDKVIGTVTINEDCSVTFEPTKTPEQPTLPPFIPIPEPTPTPEPEPTPQPELKPEASTDESVEFEEGPSCLVYEKRTFAIYYYTKGIGGEGVDWYKVNQFTTEQYKNIIVELRPGTYYVVDITDGVLPLEVTEDVLRKAVTPTAFVVNKGDAEKSVTLPEDECRSSFTFKFSSSYSGNVQVTTPDGKTEIIVVPPGGVIEYMPTEPGDYVFCPVDNTAIECVTITIPEKPENPGYVLIPQDDLDYRDPTGETPKPSPIPGEGPIPTPGEGGTTTPPTTPGTGPTPTPEKEIIRIPDFDVLSDAGNDPEKMKVAVKELEEFFKQYDRLTLTERDEIARKVNIQQLHDLLEKYRQVLAQKGSSTVKPPTKLPQTDGSAHEGLMAIGLVLMLVSAFAIARRRKQA